MSGHGFGHASRQIEIINELAPRLPAGTNILVRTMAARWLFDRTLRVPVEIVAAPTDTGVVQVDSLQLDEQRTAQEAARFHSEWTARVADEAAILRNHDVRLVIVDAPALGCAAASAAGVPSIVCANFTWDWIYEGYAGAFRIFANDVLPAIRESYAKATGAWRLPLHGGFATVPDVNDVPFVARHAGHSRDEVLERLSLPRDRPLALSSFGGYGIDRVRWEQLDCRRDWTVVTTGRGVAPALPGGISYVDEARIYESGLRYEDLVAAVDVVVSKPGYGIVSECIANGTALLYTSRGHFVEYDVMVRDMPRLMRCAHIQQDDLLADRWLASLESLQSQPHPAPVPTDGAKVIAAAILRML